MAQLTCQNLTVGYDGRTVLQGLNFEVNPGDYLCIVGENGSGKSTLMKTILGLQAPIGGRILTGDGLRKNEIGYLPQQTQAQKDFPASVREIVLSGCQGRCGSRPFYSKEEKRLAEENIEKMGIGSLTKRCYRELSGGQQQRFAIARALANKPEILFADEPTGNLDGQAGRLVVDLLRELNRELGVTLVLVTHDLGVAEQAERILHLTDGKIVRDSGEAAI